jgi:hypothetical protein
MRVGGIEVRRVVPLAISSYLTSAASILSNSNTQSWLIAMLLSDLNVDEYTTVWSDNMVLLLCCLLLENNELKIGRRSKPTNSLYCPHAPTLITEPGCMPICLNTLVIGSLLCPSLRVTFFSATRLFALLLAQVWALTYLRLVLALVAILFGVHGIMRLLSIMLNRLVVVFLFYLMTHKKLDFWFTLICLRSAFQFCNLAEQFCC